MIDPVICTVEFDPVGLDRIEGLVERFEAVWQQFDQRMAQEVREEDTEFERLKAEKAYLLKLAAKQSGYIDYKESFIRDLIAEVEKMRKALAFMRSVTDRKTINKIIDNLLKIDNANQADFHQASGVIPWSEGDEPAEDTIRKLRGGDA